MSDVIQAFDFKGLETAVSQLIINLLVTPGDGKT